MAAAAAAGAAAAWQWGPVIQQQPVMKVAVAASTTAMMRIPVAMCTVCESKVFLRDNDVKLCQATCIYQL